MWRILLILAPMPALADSIVASKMIRAHTPLKQEYLSIVQEDIPGAISDFNLINGMETLVAVYPGHPILSENLAAAAVIERNQIVALRYANPGLDIVTEGRALMRGAVGDYIEVMNLNSRRKISGQIEPDGVVRVGPES